MFHDPNTDNTGFSTPELICALCARLDAPSSLLAVLGLMVSVSDELSIDRQYRMANTLIDAASMIQERPAVREWADRLGLPTVYNDEEATSCPR